MSSDPLTPQAIEPLIEDAGTDTIAVSHEEAEQIVDSIRDLRERVSHKQAAQEAIETPVAPTGFRAALRSAFGGT